MARHAQPRELADLKGAGKKHPERYRNEVPQSEHDLGVPPDHMSAAAKEVWFELVTYALKGVLTGSDRLVLEVTSVLVAQFRADPEEMPAARLTQMVGCLARLGLTPADRQKLGTAKPAEGNPFDEF